MPLSISEQQQIEQYLKRSCASSSCEDFLKKFVALMNDGSFSRFLVDEMGVSDPGHMLEPLGTIQAVNFNDSEPECIDNACADIVRRLSSLWS